MTKDFGTHRVYFDGKDDIVIKSVLTAIRGGAVLDTDEYGGGDKVLAGQIVIRSTEDGSYKPMPIEEGKYTSLPENYKYAGVVITSVPASAPFTSVLIAGDVNEKALPYKIDDIKEALIAALPGITWTEDVL